MKTFGDFVQRVLSICASEYGWDEPYGVLSPQYDQDGDRLNLLYEHFNLNNDSPEYVAGLLNETYKFD